VEEQLEFVTVQKCQLFANYLAHELYALLVLIEIFDEFDFFLYFLFEKGQHFLFLFIK
jgi:hypothetical protein